MEGDAQKNYREGVVKWTKIHSKTIGRELSK